MQHLAIIPDGNRRWAVAHKLESVLGHKKGLEAVEAAVRVALKNGIKYLSLYAFSFENFRRSDFEKNYLFSLLAEEFKKQIASLVKNGIKVCFIGDAKMFPEQVREAIVLVQEKTQHLDKLMMHILFCYGSRQEIVAATKKIAEKVKNGELALEAIDEKTISNALWTAGTPDPDLIIRTSGAARLSNFMLFQAAYSEFKFLDCYWPEVSDEILQSCVDEFTSVKRNFGK